ncbi:hypothetical protein B0H63DRAFT_512788 [Podospora didyma]|uniref:Uncharacterized protein n=1 Tax=Podospora didyma TaxID=330526 RepID=A0AAE0N9T0_9PEZI|nr:hypothetical protein B0H63DRAFT_512788 [Podospora didyma]
MSQIIITVNNKSPNNEAFLIFNQLPSDSSIPHQIFTNTWGKADEVNSGGGQATFQITENFYAICGSAPSSLAKGLVISVANHKTADLTTGSKKGSNWKIDIPPNSHGLLFGKDTSDSDAPGGFTINTVGDTWVSSDYPTHYCGLGRDDPTGNGGGVVPVAVFAPDANQTYKITPERKFWISYGGDIAGLQTEIKDFGTPVLVDFTNKTETQATVDLEANYSWSDVKFSP